MKITVCSGSCCYKKGSEKLINFLKREIEEKELQSKIDLAASFCLGSCTNGFNLKVNKKKMSFENSKEAIDYFSEIFKELA